MSGFETVAVPFKTVGNRSTYTQYDPDWQKDIADVDR